MFDHLDSVIGLLPGESPETLEAEDQLAYEVTCRGLADGWVEPDRHVLPGDLEDISPGVFLAAIVGSVDPERLNGHDAVRLMQAQARLSSHHDAGKYRAMTEVACSPLGAPDSPVERSPGEVEYAAAEIATALTITRRAAESELDRAVSLAGRLKRVWRALSQGFIDVRKARVFDSQLSHLPEETVDTVLDETLDDAVELTTGQLQHRVSRQVMTADPDGAASSFQEGLEDRKVVANPNPDFTGSLHILNGHPNKIAAARDNIEQQARKLKTGDETRTLDQLRSDVALGLLAGNESDTGDNGGGKTNITISAETLVRLSDQPGDLDGYAPVIAEIARKTVRKNIDGEWVFTVTDNGEPVATGTLARRPTNSQQRQIQVIYPTCVFPGCRQPAAQSDLDHRDPRAEGGATTNRNLAPLCRHHHLIRHNTPWKYERLPNGDHKWTSPLGHSYIRKRDPPDE